MSRPVSISDTTTFMPVSLDTVNSDYPGTYYSTNVLENAFTDASSSTRWAPYTNTGSNAATTIYLNFDCSEIPEGATINSISCSVKCGTQGTSYYGTRTVQMATGTTVKGSATTMSGSNSSPQTHNLTVGSWTAAEVRNAKLKFYIVRGTSNTTTEATFSIYGATLTVSYSFNGTAYTITASSTIPSVTVEPASQEEMGGGSAVVTIHTGDISPYKVTDNGTNVTSSVAFHSDSGAHTASNVLGAYTLVSGGFNSGESYFSGRVGHSHTDTTTTTNYYSSGSGTIAVFTYDVPFTNIPSNATITSVYCMVTGKAESTSNSNEYMCVQIYSGDTALSNELNFKSTGSTNVSTQTVTCTTTPTIAQLEDLKIRCRLGYYGGNISGATVYVEYTTPAEDYYTYTLTNLAADHTVILAIKSIIYVKENGTWSVYSKVYKKINGSWVEQADPTTVLNNLTKYRKRN